MAAERKQAIDQKRRLLELFSFLKKNILQIDKTIGKTRIRVVIQWWEGKLFVKKVGIHIIGGKTSIRNEVTPLYCLFILNDTSISISVNRTMLARLISKNEEKSYTEKNEAMLRKKAENKLIPNSFCQLVSLHKLMVKTKPKDDAKTVIKKSI